MEHYVCTACGGVSQTPGVCQTDGCEKKGVPLVSCSCTDGGHKTMLSKKK